MRRIEVNQFNLEIQRQAVFTAIQNVVLARSALDRPPQVGEQPGQGQGPTTTRDLVGALESLQGAQNAFVSIWVTYEALRRALDFNLGTMQLTPEGLWDEPRELTAEYLLEDLEMNEYVYPPPETLMMPVEGFDGAIEQNPEEIEPPDPAMLDALDSDSLPDPREIRRRQLNLGIE